MIFTDDDLKRLKTQSVNFENCVNLQSKKAKALLSRMEAAEAVCEAEDSNLNSLRSGLMDDRVLEALQAWRKAAGK